MASIPRTQPIRIEPRPVVSEQEQRRRRHLFLKAVILLTVPLYCAGLTLLATLRIQAVLNRAASSPILLGGLVLFILLLLAEPFTGTVTNSCAVGAKCAAAGAADPVSCLTAIGVLAGIVTLAVWLLL